MGHVLPGLLDCGPTWGAVGLSGASVPSQPVLAQVHERLGPELASLEPALQVDVVWALCVLQQVQETELRAILDPSFYTQFLGEFLTHPQA